QFAGGLSEFYYSYTWVSFSGSGETVGLMTVIFTTASWVYLGGILFWTLDMLLGIITLRFILGKSTKKRVYILVTLLVLIYAIPALISGIFSFISGFGYYLIPLPFIPLLMLLFSKFVHAPVQEEIATQEMIRVPLRTRISSIFMRGKNNEKPMNSEIDYIEESEPSDD
ncbi:MAG: hypothetical protein ACFFEV_09400, partial [Candidatus Thorarchaeota archaeon]